MTSPICVFVHVEDGELDVGDEQSLLCTLLLDVLDKDSLVFIYKISFIFQLPLL